MLEKIKRMVKNNEIADIYLTGFVDIEDGIAEFHHDLRYVYFEINSKYLKFESINQFERLKLKIVDHIDYNFEIDEDWVKANSSVREIILNQTPANGNKIAKIIFYNLEEGDELICDAAEMKLMNGQVIFLDPSYIFGINIGGKKQKKLWKYNLKDPKNVTKSYLKI